MLLSLFSPLLHQFSIECGGLSSHNVPWPAVVYLAAPWVPQIGHKGALTMGALVHMCSGAPATALSQHTAMPKSHIPPFSIVIMPQSKENNCQADMWGVSCNYTAWETVTPSHESHQPTHLRGRSIQPPCLVLPSTLWKIDTQVITTAPLQFTDGNWRPLCFPLQGVGCIRQTYSAVEDICLEGVTASLSLDLLSINTRFTGL